VILEEQHTAVGKETGETAHVECWNNTLRQRLARFVRMTLSLAEVVERGTHSKMLDMSGKNSFPTVIHLSSYFNLSGLTQLCLQCIQPR
jgi:hypothetical protein